ncbi:NADP-dependent oxidoreductase [Acidocella aquatica]|uniref:NADP-dependent oxidoreductase n=1 Tax=Acidocella aquatica TaxID=1922313 RepID=A0ABQ6A2J9_9PROT|nr:NADP-dependent oxidoreductase [Acidocella aquatica]GLR65475.1 NADP-dependent oxidoreductase [Acidocella aquatica]
MTNFIPAHSTPDANRQIVLASRPAGIPLATDFALRTVPAAKPAEGQFLVRNLYLSADPVQRGWAANPALTPLGAPLRALAVGVVVESRDAAINTGDIVYGFLGWQDYALATQAELLSHIPTPRAPVSTYAGVLGMPGVTAWLALNDLAPVSPGQAVLVSTAAGAVGSVVGQIARHRGAHVTGLTGSAEKIERCITRFGYNAAFNYKTGDLAQTLAQAQPGGFNTYFDNTGGPILDTAIRALAKYGRIIQCGTAATASWNPPPTGLRNEREILTRVLTWSGFYIFDHIARFNEAIGHLSALMQNHGLEHDEDISNGIEHAAGSLEILFAGTNTGKKLIFIG